MTVSQKVGGHLICCGLPPPSLKSGGTCRPPPRPPPIDARGSTRSPYAVFGAPINIERGNNFVQFSMCKFGGVA